ncbi:hypothetical protein PVK06_031715 [Gossypium arboreum]|uniref:RNase H type-1 domain-containing protein n=1 Tax=Gossypium arboreum TaxID=29729 RepID=A0ABR0NUE8_GOSAR|nr:hypothetical protein PVK06_031715 [Gossypium arboreum]
MGNMLVFKAIIGMPDGLRLLWEHGYRRAIVEIDSLSASKQLTGKPKIENESTLVCRIKLLLLQSWEIKVVLAF